MINYKIIIRELWGKIVKEDKNVYMVRTIT